MPEMTERFESWAVVEVFGHQTFAGFATEQSIGGCSFVRVDVPELPEVPENGYYRAKPAQPAFTKMFSQGAIYSITPCDEAMARAVANNRRAEPLNIAIMPVARQIETRRDDDYIDSPVEDDEEDGGFQRDLALAEIG